MTPKEFEELHSVSNIDNLIFEKSRDLIISIQKDAWNAAVRWSADNAKITNESTEHITGYLTSEFVVDKQSILNGLIE